MPEYFLLANFAPLTFLLRIFPMPVLHHPSKFDVSIPTFSVT
jgi:hypothetical protein